jgi:hypothetical protein
MIFYWMHLLLHYCTAWPINVSSLYAEMCKEFAFLVPVSEHWRKPFTIWWKKKRSENLGNCFIIASRLWAGWFEVSILCKDIFLFSKLPRLALGPLSLLFSGYRSSFSGVKQLGHGVDLSLVLRLNGATPVLLLNAVMAWTGMTLLFILFCSDWF